ncbi:hypothetical protein [Paenibacillus anseongense]|uniref:hypothetical protein n=1 Tax=Paenibacillus anseongense TaxID=2682845 RepID=UPI001C86AD35|nr:hypothetical protein [Paenibacillus anseongense]
MRSQMCDFIGQNPLTSGQICLYEADFAASLELLQRSVPFLCQNGFVIGFFPMVVSNNGRGFSMLHFVQHFGLSSAVVAFYVVFFTTF